MSEIVWSQTKMKLKDLKPHPSNPRKVPKDKYEALVENIRVNGYTNRLIVNLDGVILGGNQRLKALKKLGYTEVDVLVPNIQLTEEQENRINISDNLSAGDWDFDMLGDRFDAEQLMDWGMPAELLNFEVTEIEAEDGDNDVPEISGETIAKPGDIWLLGEHRLMCGDSASMDAIDKLLDKNTIDLIFTDPPYNVGFNGRSGKFDIIKNDNLPEPEFVAFIQEIAGIITALSCPNYYIWCNWKFYNLLQGCLSFKACIVWAKNVFGMGNGYRHQHEFCLFNGAIDENIKNESDLWEIAKDKDYVHPTQKPVELAFRAFKNHKRANNVLDLFGGSGSTLIACERANKKCFMMELDPHYCDVIIARWEKVTGQKAVLE